MKTQGTILSVSLLLLVVGVLMIPACTTKEPTMSPVERGKYLVMAGGCNDCHSPKVFTPAGPIFDTTRLLSGHPANSPLPEIPKGVIGPTQWGALTTNDLTAWAGPWE